MWLPSKFSLLGRRAAATGISDPPTIFGASLIAWYKADTEVYNDAGTTLAADTETVQQWNDQSGNDYHLSLTGASGNLPTFLSTGLGGLPTVSFNHAKWLKTVDDAVSLGGDILAAFLVCTAGGTNSYNRLCTFIGSTTSGNDADVKSGITLIQNFNTFNITGFRSGGLKNDTLMTEDQIYRLGGVFDGSNHTIYLDNSGQTPAATTGTFDTLGAFHIGGEPDPSTGWDGLVSEVVITNAAPDAGQRDDLDAYFVDKWGL
jgi:hypothetical protein